MLFISHRVPRKNMTLDGGHVEIRSASKSHNKVSRPMIISFNLVPIGRLKVKLMKREICRGGHVFHWICIKITNCHRVHLSIIIAKFGPYWYSICSDDTANVQRCHPPEPTTDAKWWNKLTWPIGPGELHRIRTWLLELMHLKITCLLHSGKVYPSGGLYWFYLVNGILTQQNVYTFWKNTSKFI